MAQSRNLFPPIPFDEEDGGGADGHRRQTAEHAPKAVHTIQGRVSG